MTHPPFHPVCTLFRPLRGQEREDFYLDVELHGIQEPVWTWTPPGEAEQIIDGQNRVSALVVANRRRAERGEQPWPLPTQQWDGRGSLIEFVFSRNIHRRHLDETERAMMAARAAAMIEAEAEARQKAGLKQGDKLPSASKDANGKTKAKSAQTVAKLANVSPASVERARRVIRHGTPELVEAVDAGKMKVSRAAEVSKLAPAEQRERIRDEASRAESDVRQHDLRDTFDRWMKTAEKLHRQMIQHDPRIPASVKQAAKLQAALAADRDRLLDPPEPPPGGRAA